MIAFQTDPTAATALTTALDRVERQVFVAPPALTVAEWCDRHRILSREAHATGGPWRTENAPYQRDVLNLIGDLDTPEVVLMWSSQVGKTEALLNGIAYLSACDPCPQLVVQPSIQDAESFSRKRVAPMIRDTPALTKLYADPKSRDGGNTLLEKQYLGGVLTLRGANAPSGLAGQPIRVVWFDEVDRAPASAGEEGDPITLAARRTETFWNAQRWYVSSPTHAGTSRIEAKYAASSQGQFWVPCPECDHYQTLRWREDDGTYRVTFERAEDGEVIEASVGYVCESCACVIPERKKMGMLRRGEWRHRFPTRRTKGFHLSALYSPWATWAHVAREFLAAKHSKETLKTFDNTMLGLPFKDDGQRVEPHVLAARAEPLLEPLHPDIGALTVGFDLQGDRGETLLVGWGAGERAFVLERRQWWGDPQRDDVWQELTAYVRGTWDGLPIAAIAADTGYQPDRVWRWVDAMGQGGPRVIGIKGMPGRFRPILARPAATTRRGVRSPWLVGVDSAKDALAARLAVVPTTEGEYPPTAIRFDDGLDAAFYEGVTAEELKSGYVNGRPVLQWRVIPGRANEPLDTLVYALAALHRLGASTIAKLAPRPPRASADDPPSPAATPRIGPPSFLTSWKW